MCDTVSVIPNTVDKMQDFARGLSGSAAFYTKSWTHISLRSLGSFLQYDLFTLQKYSNVV